MVFDGKEFKKKAWGYALKNAVEHGGTINAGSVFSGLFHEFPKQIVLKNKSTVDIIISETESLSLPEQKIKFIEFKFEVSERKHREGLPELPNVKKSGVIMRFAPSASGPLHIGHAMTSGISFLYVEKYGGKFYIRIEDTNPENIYKPSYKMIEEESKWLFDDRIEILIQSFRMNIYYKYIEKLIKKNSSYVCTCTPEEFKKFVSSKKDCPCRKLSAKENINRWKKMLDKSLKGFKQGEAVLRFKSDMKDKNPAMRDFPLARINLTKHPLQKNKYRVWPLMNLAVSVDDIETKVTHVIRAKDHRDNAKKQEMIYSVLKKKFPWTAFLGRFKFKGFELSTTKIKQEIDKGKYSGWGDKRLPTMASLKKQGYKPGAFLKFAEQIGLSGTDKVIDKKEYFILLNSFNEKTL